MSDAWKSRSRGKGHPYIVRRAELMHQPNTVALVCSIFAMDYACGHFEVPTQCKAHLDAVQCLDAVGAPWSWPTPGLLSRT